MIFRSSGRKAPSGTIVGPRAADAESARRALRARNHLERKRARERTRRARERRRSEPTMHDKLIQHLVGPLMLAGGFAAGALATGFFVDTVLLRNVSLDRIEVEGASVLTGRAIASAAALERGDLLGEIDPDAISRRLEANPWIDAARTLRVRDGGLVISIVERSVVARWQTNPGEESILVDSKGLSFPGQHSAHEKALELPLVQGAMEDDALPADALMILEGMQQEPRLSADSIEMTLHLPTAAETHGGYVLQLGSDGPRALLGQTLLRERIARLAAILERVELELDGSRLIDLRYADRAVLQTVPTSG